MVMLDLLWRLSRDEKFSLHIAHFDHRLRGDEGALEAELVRRAAEKRGLPFSSGEGDVRGYMEEHPGGLEEAARTLRYRFLFDVMHRSGAQRLATAHHADDQVETVFLRLLRGTGLKGLTGIRPIDRRGVIRPLLCLRKEEISGYARAADLSFHEDPTNREPIGPRNVIRNRWLASLDEKDRERLAESVSELTESIAELNVIIDLSVEEALTDVCVSARPSQTKLDLEKLKSYHYIVRNGVYRFVYRRMTGLERELTRKATSNLVEFCENGQTCSEMHLPGGIRVHREYGYAVFVSHTDSGVLPGSVTIPEELDSGWECSFGGERFRLRLKLESTEHPDYYVRRALSSGGGREAVFDYEQLRQPLRLRCWKPGDRFEPFGLDGTKKVSDLLQEERIPPRQRKLLPLLVDRERILWIVGVRRSAHAPVGARTRRVVTVRLESDSEEL